ncbi:hypothetical protein LIER_22789 [Lithospermum erythrorhizon]|uniref:Uncharacterized protein n=1 Tax=Lithospermum erythrorhizon TaxID=34254 RepID=A0AAV3QV22_LITER
MEASVQNPQEAALEPQDVRASTPLGPRENSSPLPPSSPRDQRQGTPPLDKPTLVAAQENAGGQHSATVALEPKDQGGVGLATLQVGCL